MREIVVGDIIRLVAKTMAKQVARRQKKATAPFQCGLSVDLSQRFGEGTGSSGASHFVKEGFRPLTFVGRVRRSSAGRCSERRQVLGTS